MSQSGDAGAEPASRWGSSLGVVAGQRSRQRPVTITSHHGAQQVPIAVTSRHHPHRHRHTQQVSQTSGLLNAGQRSRRRVLRTQSASRLVDSDDKTR